MCQIGGISGWSRGIAYLDLHVLEHLQEVLTESLARTAMMLPLLFVVLLVVEAVSHTTASSKVSRAFSQPFVGPLAAAILGLIPQCGFSVAATTLFLEGMIPLGSLIAAYISTSDEALPVMLADRATLPWVLPLLLTKLVWGTVVGICTNAGLLLRSTQAAETNAGLSRIRPQCSCNSCRAGRPGALGIVSHALSRALRTAAMVFVLSAVLNLIGHVAQGRVYTVLSAGVLQPVVAAVVGLIHPAPHQWLLRFQGRHLSFPSVVSGLLPTQARPSDTGQEVKQGRGHHSGCPAPVRRRGSRPLGFNHFRAVMFQPASAQRRYSHRGSCPVVLQNALRRR